MNIWWCLGALILYAMICYAYLAYENDLFSLFDLTLFMVFAPLMLLMLPFAIWEMGPDITIWRRKK